MTLARPAEGAETEKRLIKLLSDYARRSTGTGFGFHIGGQEQRRRRQLALLCRVDTAEPKRVAACAEAGADAIELNNAMATPATVEQVATAVSLPWGVSVREGSFDAWQQSLAETGTMAAEWITMTMNDDARFLELTGVTKLLEVDLSLRPEILRGVAVSGADVVVVVPGEETAGGSLTVADSMRLRLLCDVVKQPVLVAAALVSRDPVGLRLLRDSGAVGLLLETSDAKSVRTLATALDGMADDAAAKGAR